MLSYLHDGMLFLSLNGRPETVCTFRCRLLLSFSCTDSIPMMTKEVMRIRNSRLPFFTPCMGGPSTHTHTIHTHTIHTHTPYTHTHHDLHLIWETKTRHCYSERTMLNLLGRSSLLAVVTGDKGINRKPHSVNDRPS